LDFVDNMTSNRWAAQEDCNWKSTGFVGDVISKEHEVDVVM
jgi:hypothetical protein